MAITKRCKTASVQSGCISFMDSHTTLHRGNSVTITIITTNTTFSIQLLLVNSSAVFGDIFFDGLSGRRSATGSEQASA